MSINFPEVELATLKRWQEIDCFERVCQLSKDRPHFTFWDGPPFATGLPHFGHLLASTIKDVIPRYWFMKGYNVERRFGWDTHGLPIEFEIDKKFKKPGRDIVEDIGLKGYNEECRGIVMRYAEQWRVTINRLGRWIDFDNGYKTMDMTYMESVWSVFKQLFDRGEVYRSFQVMPYSTGLQTPLSQFEAQQNRKDTQDIAVVVSFLVLHEDKQNTHLLVWTTTPWTLPSNIAIAINPDFEYVEILDETSGKHFIILESCMHMLYKKPKPTKIVTRIRGHQMAGWRYQPIFDYFSDQYRDCFVVVPSSHVQSDEGVGLVHMSPAYGAEDYTAAVQAGLIGPERPPPDPVDERGCFTAAVKDYAGQYVKAAERSIVRELKSRGRLITENSYTHNVAFCYRSETPLLQKAVSAWFIKVKDDIPAMLRGIENSVWVPSAVKDKRFAQWIVNARDWNVSRNRFWGNPIPIWASPDFDELICVGSIAELKELSGYTGEILDLHRHSVDHIEIPSRTGKAQLKRISEVFDCWFESGSMPYASQHYPFDNYDDFLKDKFPADFIAEGLDQTRGWFYTLTVLGIKLLKTFPFKHCIVNGIILAEDGRKMSKKEKNYPDPTLVIDQYGADALRLYLISSPAVRAEPVRFIESGLRDIVGNVLRPLWNSYRFFDEQVALLKKDKDVDFVFDPTVGDLQKSNVMDRWILAECQSLLVFMEQEMAGYRLSTVVPRLLKLIESLTNWYIRLNRTRLKGADSRNDNDTLRALNTLFEVLHTLVCALAPFIPFLTDHIFQLLVPCLPPHLKAQNEDIRSVHFVSFPKVRHALFDEIIQRQVARMQKVVELTRMARERKALGLKTPLQTLVVIADAPFLADVEPLQPYIQKELNICQVIFTSDGDQYNVELSLLADWSRLGKRLKKSAQAVRKALPNLSQEQIKRFAGEKRIEVEGIELDDSDLKAVRGLKGGDSDSKWEVNSDNEALIMLDSTYYDHLANGAIAREVISRFQRLRKAAGLVPTDDAQMQYSVIDNPGGIDFAAALEDEKQMVKTALRGSLEERTTFENGEHPSREPLAEENTTMSRATCMLRLFKLES